MDIIDYSLKIAEDHIEILFDYGLGKSDWHLVTFLASDLILRNEHGQIIRFKDYGNASNAPIYITHMDRCELKTVKVIM